MRVKLRAARRIHHSLGQSIREERKNQVSRLKSKSIHGRVSLTLYGAASLVAIAGLAGVGVAVSSEIATATTPAATTTVSIPANQTWTDTGIALTAGGNVSIAMSGTIHFAPGRHSGPNGQSFSSGNCGATQYSNPSNSSSPFPAYGVACWGSIFKVGATGIPFSTGKAISFVSPVSGELYIGVNDNYVSDNRGWFTASITTS